MSKIRNETFPIGAKRSAYFLPRRTFVFGAGALAALAVATSFAQGRIPRVGYLAGRGMPTAANPDPNGNTFVEELRKFGRIDGKNIQSFVMQEAIMTERANSPPSLWSRKSM